MSQHGYCCGMPIFFESPPRRWFSVMGVGKGRRYMIAAMLFYIAFAAAVIAAAKARADLLRK